jgi:twitching motility protein PilI
MAQGNNQSFSKLLEYDKRSTGFTPGTQSGQGPSQEWSGVTFRVGEHRMACNIDRIAEIIPLPPSTPVPGAKSWILGLANVRGELLTVIDLQQFLTGERTQAGLRSRLLTTSLNKAPIGLLIDEVFGQRHFLDSEATPTELPDDSNLRILVSQQHRAGSETWQEMNLDHLFNSPEFLNGAA